MMMIFHQALGYIGGYLTDIESYETIKGEYLR